MNRFFYSAIILSFIAGCSTPSPKIETNNKSVEINVKSAEPNAAVNKSVISSVNQSDTNAKPSPNANMTIQNFSISQDNVRNTKEKKGAGSGDTPIAQNVARNAAAAPDNSEIVSAMNAKGQPVETRSFKNHPALLKIERTDLNDSDIKVYLKNGKIVDLPEDRVDNFLTAPASDILKAVGM